jgi:hypothetical protein
MSFAQRFSQVDRSAHNSPPPQREAAEAPPLPSSITWSRFETRRMMHVDPNDPTHVDNDLPDDIGVYPVITANPTPGGSTTRPAAPPPARRSTASPRSAAAVRDRQALPLDFDGAHDHHLGPVRPGTTPAYGHR